MTESGKRVFERLVNNFNEMKEKQQGRAPRAELELDTRMSLQLPIYYKNEKHLSNLLHDYFKDTKDLGEWELLKLPPIDYGEYNPYKEEQPNLQDFVLFRERPEHKDQIEYFCIRAINQYYYKYGKYGSGCMEYFVDKNLERQMRDLYPDGYKEQPDISHRQFPNMPSDYSTSFEAFFGAVDIDDFRWEYYQSDSYHKHEIEQKPTVQEFFEKNGHYPEIGNDRYVNSEDERKILISEISRTNAAAVDIFRGKLEHNAKFIGMEKEYEITGFVPNFSNNGLWDNLGEKDRDLKNVSSWCSSFNCFNPRSEQDVFATKDQIEEMLNTIGFTQEISFEFDKPKEYIDEYLAKIKETGIRRGVDTENVIRAVIEREHREDLLPVYFTDKESAQVSLPKAADAIERL